MGNPLDMLRERNREMTTKRQQRQQVLLNTLACGATVAVAAKQAGVTERTAYRYLADPAVRQELDALQDETNQRAAARLQSTATQAIKTLLEAQNSDAPASVRRTAARRLLELGQRYREAITIEKRVTDLERQLPVAASEGAPTSVASDHSTAPASTPGLRLAVTPTARRRPRGWHAVLHALACGATVPKAAAHAHVSERTVERRLADPDFCEQLRTLKAEIVQRTSALLLTASQQACQTLIDLLAPTIAINVRCAAACDILDLGLSLGQNTELEKRLAELENNARLRLAA
jgi:DNA-binding NarL/FixJ family response regulator